MSARLDFDLDELALRRYLTSPDGEVFRWLVRLTDRACDRARLYCPTRTGRLRESLRARTGVEGQHLVGTVDSGLAYARPVHDRPGGRPFLVDGMVDAAREAGISSAA